ncbi:MAG: hypothetical protein HZA06_03720 [Nitrospirae bacterium]|nr:hypothetical protein [Nitrospirota bacterium]
MAKNIAVVNTSPIVYLSSINQLSLLKKLFIEKLKENGFWLSNIVYKAILREAGE